MSRQARIGIIGAGYWATYFYLPYIEASPDAHCVGVVRRNQDALEALRSSFHLEVATTEVDELLEAGCDGIIVASPHSMHLEHARSAIEAGCNVLVEKPMTLSLADARELSLLTDSCGRLVTVANGWNYSPIATWATDLVRSGGIGEVRALSGTMASAVETLYAGTSGYGSLTLGDFKFEAESETYADPGSGGGYLYGQLSHMLGLALSMLEAEPEEVFARLGLLDNGADVEDALSVRFANGAVASFYGTASLPWGMRYPLDLRIFGDRGTIVADFGADRAAMYATHDDDLERFPLDDGTQAFTSETADELLATRPGDGLYNCDGPIQKLIDGCLGRDTTDRVPVSLGVRTVAVLESAYRSARSGKLVKVADL